MRSAFAAVDDDGFHYHVYDARNLNRRIFSHTIGALSQGPYLSHDAEIAVIASTEKTGIAEYALEAYDLSDSGALIAELWDGEGKRCRRRRLFSCTRRHALCRLLKHERLPPSFHLESHHG